MKQLIVLFNSAGSVSGVLFVYFMLDTTAAVILGTLLTMAITYRVSLLALGHTNDGGHK